MTDSLSDLPAPGSANFFCSDCSRVMGEQQFGTTARVDVWYALEYNGPWPRKAVSDNDLPPEVLARLNAPLGELQTRLQFIRQDRSMLDRPVQFFVAVADELVPRLYGFSLLDYDALLELDLGAIAAGDPRYDDALIDEPLFLVCTNGKRDRACALYGLPVYQAFETVTGSAAWQTTHLSGHRFAATALLLPHGLGCGRIPLTEVPRLARAYREGLLLPDFYRGRSCYDPVVQAAEYYLRSETGEYRLAAFRLLASELTEDGTAVVRFGAVADAAIHTVWLREESAALEVYTSSADEAPSPVTQYSLVAHEVLPAEANA